MFEWHMARIFNHRSAEQRGISCICFLAQCASEILQVPVFGRLVSGECVQCDKVVNDELTHVLF